MGLHSVGRCCAKCRGFFRCHNELGQVLQSDQNQYTQYAVECYANDFLIKQQCLIITLIEWLFLVNLLIL